MPSEAGYQANINQINTMKGTRLIIKFIGDKAYLTDEKALSLNRLSLSPATHTIMDSIYWEVEYSKYFEDEQRLSVNLISSQITGREFYEHQKKMSNELNKVERVSFVKRPHLYDLKYSFHLGGGQNSPPPSTIKRLPPKPVTHQIRETYSVHLDDVTFYNGYASIKKSFSRVEQAVELKTYNSEIIEEFNYLKFFLKQRLGKDIVTINVEIVAENLEAKSVQCYSADIESIKKSWLKEFHLDIMSGMIKNLGNGNNKPITIKQLFGGLTGGKLKPELIYSKPSDAVKDLLSITDAKHSHHIQYLNTHHLYNLIEPCFLLLQSFSCIFLIEGKKNYFIVWETLKTEEATYTWRITKNESTWQDEYDSYMEIINGIRVQGRREYLDTHEDLSFKRIIHDYKEENDGFAKWRKELEEIIG